METYNNAKKAATIISITVNHEAISMIYPFADRCLFSLDTPQAHTEDPKTLNDLMDALLHAKELAGRAATFQVNSTLYAILHLLYSRFTTGVRKPESLHKDRNLVMQILGYLDTHYAEPLSEQGAAHDFGYSCMHFSRLFKMATGKGFRAYITSRRLDDAHHRLIDPSKA
ncbi:hypothetical protein CRD60_01940 [Bifidobacterium aemilianum]|uniref:HTH araC/xylS-type domain-containing protein n=1 Tax=Bifidobacterium aemilianum TaxID=2493120 RepID=A0A366KBR3_9BIFI|nr:AraC family transcriptional regulator [Bifidobacterium aemilianum]RBP98628.1 hypothetical protein CRD60_01940 [Bifidobacterium aemilianum]